MCCVGAGVRLGYLHYFAPPNCQAWHWLGWRGSVTVIWWLPRSAAKYGVQGTGGVLVSGYKEADMRYHDTHPATLYVLAPLWHMASDGPSSYVVLTENVQIVLNKIVQCNEICCCLLNSIWEVYDVIVCMSSTSERAFIHCRHLAAGAGLLRAVSHLTVITGSWIHRQTNIFSFTVRLLHHVSAS